MTVVHVNTESGWAGGEVQTCYLMEGLAGRGVQGILIAQPGSELAGRASAMGMQVVPMRMRGECDPVAVLRLGRVLQQIRPDVLHLHTSHAHTLGWLAGRLAGIGSIVVTRRMDRPVKGYSARLKYRRVDHIVAISRAVHKRLAQAGLPSEKLSLIYSGADGPAPGPEPDLRSTYHLDLEVPVIGTIATLSKHKGHACVLEAMRIVKQRHPRARLLIVGSGPDESHLRDLVRRLDLDGHVVFTGFRRDIPRVLSTLNLFVLASENEGLSIALLEAACSGLPIVATDVGGMPEIIRDGVTGLLVPANDPEALADRIVSLLDDPQRARELGDHARALVREQFSVAQMVDGYHRLYGSLIASRSRQTRICDPAERQV